ncbi:thioredoxin TrxC [Mesorhizobium sp. YC-39]|uniref:thioredoxin TrxC n=1 Tax=unclassified Mesorhizobium TaxID=325217 RepID=UPI0021E7CCE0|nr:MULTISPECIES: thioredoxin TrxC [unclassified Mesorhizobium]MCV3205481.1 thioredoxin TrxC [Mesorhizobium sp. YC-2]MCV3228120.1 thioredoxin TrxC [Mesorhizobium sp. YC-39]
MAQQNLVVCSKCGGVNRLPPARDAMDAKCGKCGNRLFSCHPEDVDTRVFDCQIARSSLPVVVDVWAPWCGPCKMMAPAYEAAANELEPYVRLIKLNSDNEQALSARLGIRGIPTMILFHGGREIARTSGAMTTGQIVRWIRDHLPMATA